MANLTIPQSGSFIPKHLIIKSHINSPFKGVMKKVKYCYYSIREGKKRPVYIEQYYDKNFAKTEMISVEDLLKINKSEISTNNIETYNNAF